MDYDIFISYRRHGAQDLAGRIKDHLSAAGYRPFFDVESMKSGRFDHQLYSKIDACEHFLLVLPPNGLKRCNKKDDWVRKEIEYALEKKKHIITVLMPGFVFPKRLPASLEVIRNVQAIVPTPETFDHTIARIIEYLNDPNWSPAEYEYEDKSMSPSRPSILSIIPMMLLALVALLTGLFLWQPWVQNNPYAEDKTAPTVYISSFIGTTLKDGYIKQGESISFTVEFSDNVGVKKVDLLPDSILLSPGLIADIEISGSGNTRMISLNNISGTYGDHYVTIPANVARDAAGNHNFALKSSSFILQGVDSTIPTINIARPTFDNGAISFVVYTDDNVQLQKLEIDPLDISTHGFIGNIEVRGKGNSNREIIITNCKPIGSECYIEIAEGVAVDAAGNKSKSVRSHTFDISKPALTISAPSKESITAGEAVSYTIATADNVQVIYFGIHKDDIKMVGFTADIEIVEKDDFVRQIIFSNVQSTSTEIKYFVIAEGVAKDALGNGNYSKNSPAFEIK